MVLFCRKCNWQRVLFYVKAKGITLMLWFSISCLEEKNNSWHYFCLQISVQGEQSGHVIPRIQWWWGQHGNRLHWKFWIRWWWRLLWNDIWGRRHGSGTTCSPIFYFNHFTPCNYFNLAHYHRSSSPIIVSLIIGIMKVVRKRIFRLYSSLYQGEKEELINFISWPPLGI